MIARTARNIFFVALCLLTAVEKTAAESRPELKFLKPAEIPSIGLRLNIMPESREVPIPPPQVFRYTMSQDEKKWNVEMYSPAELWRTSQHAGSWTDQRSSILTIATITTLFPSEKFKQPHVPKDYYNKIMAEAGTTPVDWTDENINRWLKAFTGAKDLTAQPTPRLLSHLKGVKVFDFSNNSLGCVFRINRPSSPGSAAATSILYFAAIELNPKVDPIRAQKSINEQFLPSLAPIKMAQKQAIASTSFQSAAFAGKKQKSAEFMASRRQVSDGIRNMKDWWFAETDNYIFLSNMKSKHRVVIKDLQEHIEYLRDAFEQFMPPRTEIKAVSVIRAFASSDEYSAYVNQSFADLAWSWGLWSSTHKELLIRPIDAGQAKYQRETFFTIVCHEAFHQYIFYAFDQKSPAAWFNEGHADFYSVAMINERKLSVGENQQRTGQVDKIIASRELDIKNLIHLSYDKFYAKNKETMLDNYALSWALIYYLRKSAPLETPPKYAKILDKYADALWETGDGEKATEAAFKEIDISALQRDFIMFWSSQKKRGAALRNNIFKTYNPSLKK